MTYVTYAHFIPFARDSGPLVQQEWETGVCGVCALLLMLSLDTRIERYLDKCPPAISGQGGHDQTFKVACALVWGFALSPDRALHYLEIYNLKCQPAWSASELVHKVNSAKKVRCDKPVGYLRCSKEHHA